jgi:hypothetical protein
VSHARRVGMHSLPLRRIEQRGAAAIQPLHKRKRRMRPFGNPPVSASHAHQDANSMQPAPKTPPLNRRRRRSRTYFGESVR